MGELTLKVPPKGKVMQGFMTWKEALDELDAEQKVKRINWEEGRFIRKIYDHKFKAMLFEFDTPTDFAVGWQPSDTDQQAEDWIVIKD